MSEIIFSNDITPLRKVDVYDNEIIVTYQFKGAIHQPDPLYLGSKFYKIPGFGINDYAGEPAVPFRSDCISLPQGASYNISIIETQYIDTSFVLSPARPLRFESDTTRYTLYNVPAISPYVGFYPQTIIDSEQLTSFHDVNLLRLCIYPLQYNYETHTARIYSLIKYKVLIINDNKTWPASQFHSRKTKSLLERISINNVSKTIHQTIESRTNSHNEVDNQYYLIITTDNYLSSIQDFVEWKRLKGKRVIVKSKTYWNSTNEVKDSIVNVYNSVGDSLHYLLLVGGKNNIPSYYRTNVYSHVTDLYYACMGDSSDYIPEFHRGRILVNTPSEALHVFDKIIQYEKDPIDSVRFYQKGLHTAYFQPRSPILEMEDRRFTLTSEEILNYIQSLKKNVDRVYYTSNNAYPTYWNNDIYANGGLVPDSLRKPYFAWNGNYSDINYQINNGCFYVLKRGHGEVTYWEWPYYNKRHINLLQNEKKYPVVYSICCLSGKFNTSQTCFAEAFLKKEKAGCVGIIAATENSFSGHNDILAETMFDAIWPDTILRIRLLEDFDQRPLLSKPVYELGEILDDGLTYMEDVGWRNHLGENLNNSRSLYTREIFHCFGDPSMMMYTEEPAKFNQPSIDYRNGKICVQSPCDSTRITFYTPSLTQPIVDSFLGNYVEYETRADSVIVCLDKHNYVPYIQTFHKNLFIQNENINDDRIYLGDSVLVGHHVTTQKPVGDVVIENANVFIKGNIVELHPGTTITHSNVIINGN